MGRVGADWRRRLRGLGEVVVGGRRVVVGRVSVRARLFVAELVTMFGALEEVEVVVVGDRRGLEGAAEGAVVGGSALLEEVLGAVVELARCCDLTIVSSGSHARPPATSRHCPVVDEMALLDLCFADGLVVYLALALRCPLDLELDPLVVALVAHARILLHVPWLRQAGSRVL